MAESKRTPLHAAWQFRAKAWPAPLGRLGYSRLEWLPADVPGHVHLDLQQRGIIAEPLAALHELGVQWVDEEDWIYRTQFEFSPDPARPRRVLCFDCLDTVCQVFLDGQLLTCHDNMFVPLEIDVSERLVAGRHELRVEFESAARVGRQRRAAYFQREGLPEHTVRFEERAFVRKSQCMFGWDWGPRLVSAGIAGAVNLLQYSGRLLDVHVTQSHHPDGSVELTFSSRCEAPQGATVWHFVDGFPRPVRDGEPLLITQPRLWWPQGLGQAELYGVHSLLAESEPAGPSADALDRKEFRIGLRRLRLVREPDAHGESFQFEVNGEPLYALGANWIPDHAFPSLVDRGRLAAQLRRAIDLDMNLLRVWGGGLYESEEFYELCDELGLLVWQDFAFACSYYPDDAEAQRIVAQEARANVTRLRNHASLALWCGNNENHEMFDKGWDGRENNPPRFYGEVLYHQTLPAVVAELDPARPYIPSSPIGGEHPNDGGHGDQHYWDVWHGRGDWKHYQDSRARFCSEFGFASAPGPRSWARIAPDALNRDVRDPLARWHDKTLKGYETFLDYVALHYPRAETLEQWMYFSQLNQRDALRHGIEHFRRSEYCKGTLIWQLNDVWPAQSWAVLDFDGDYKAAAFELRRLYASALCSLEVGSLEVGSLDLDAEVARCWVILDNARAPFRGLLELEARALSDGALLWREGREIELLPGERRVALECPLSGFERAETILWARFAGHTCFRLLSEPKEARFTRPELDSHWDGEVLYVETSGPVVDLFVWDPTGEVQFLDNFFTLPTAGRLTFRVQSSHARSGRPSGLRARSLAGAHSL